MIPTVRTPAAAFVLAAVLPAFADRGPVDPAEAYAFRTNGVAVAKAKIAELAKRRAGMRLREGFGPHVATGGGFGGQFVWDTCFNVLWAKYEAKEFPVFESLDNLYRRQEADGFLCREGDVRGNPVWSREHPNAFNPPLRAWAELNLYDYGISSVDRLRRVYPLLKRNYGFIRSHYRRGDGLYFGDTYGCGMDDLPRMPKDGFTEADRNEGIPFRREYLVDPSLAAFGESLAKSPRSSWNRQIGWIDLTSQVALKAECLARMAKILGNGDDWRYFRGEHAAIAKAVNEKCWSDEMGFYGDCWRGGVIRRYHVGAVWPLVAGLVPPERRAAVVKTLCDPKIFNTPVPFPALAVCEPEYSPEDTYWRGPSWPPTTYVALKGLERIGEKRLAREFALRYYRAALAVYRNAGGQWENLSSAQCDRPKRSWSSRDYAGWANLVSIAIYEEYVKGTFK